MLKSEYEGIIPLEELDIEVVILIDNNQVINEASVKKILYNYKKVLNSNAEIISYQNKKGKTTKGFYTQDFYDLCVGYLSAKEARQSSIDFAKKVLNIFSEFGGHDMINEVTGYNMKKKIEKKLKELLKNKKKELSEFDKKILQALNFSSGNKKK